MKITDFAILFVALVFPFFFILGMQSHHMQDTAFIEMKYTSGLRTAVQDAGVMLTLNEDPVMEAGYVSAKYFRADKEKALQAFSKTLYVNMGVADDPKAQEALWWYIPALAVIDYNGFYIYSMQSVPDEDGRDAWKHVWSPKIPYSYMDADRNMIYFTLDDKVTAFNEVHRTWISGFQKELAGTTGISLLDSVESFEGIRRTTIVHSIQDNVAYYIHKHNEIALRSGISYQFNMPVIGQEEWVNTIDDIGFMAFVQGIPVGDKAYNNYALGGGRLIKKPTYYGVYDYSTDRKIVVRDSCAHSYEIQEVFQSPKAAAEAGYIEGACLHVPMP
ncbi:hypothetical protein [Paenibacillus lemnae]|uniref:F0F1-type ATP synthase n=1 Tax=Paenibacillus lemnae TaxID=1330551 RepID=A0A848M4F6_PAELE|nr:hypothetical protein [Paenibacillus lemnae]NMO95948.1 hypothetical protein [Paenibacillus lemnae]